MLNSDHETDITGTPMPHGKPQIQIGCGVNAGSRRRETQPDCPLCLREISLVGLQYRIYTRGACRSTLFYITFINLSQPRQSGTHRFLGVPGRGIPHKLHLRTIWTSHEISPCPESFQRPGRAPGVRCSLPSGSIQTGLPSRSQCERECPAFTRYLGRQISSSNLKNQATIAAAIGTPNSRAPALD
jgi:hypothetical protein